MALVDINWQPSKKQLRQFGMICAVALPALGWFWSHGNLRVTGWLLGIGLCMGILGQFVPGTLRPIFVGLTVLTMPIALVVSELALLLIFFGVVLPTGLLLYLTGHDLLKLNRDEGAVSYWTPRKQPRDLKSYYQQF